MVFGRTNVSYELRWCRGGVDFPITLPTTTVKVWRITIIKSSDIVTVQIHCNGVEAVNAVLSDSTCIGIWSSYWKKDTFFLYFDPKYNTAATHYRPYSPGKCNSKNNTICEYLKLPPIIDYTSKMNKMNNRKRNEFTKETRIFLKKTSSTINH